MQHSKFVIGEDPYCVWDWNLNEINLDFLNGINPDYFDFLIDKNYNLLDSDEDKK